MDETEAVPVRRQPHIVLRVVQWVVAVFVGLIALAVTSEIRKLGTPGAPIILYWVALGFWIATAAVLAPPIFFRLPKVGKAVSYGAIVASLIIFSAYLGRMEGPYSRSPEGIKEAAANKARDVAAAEMSVEEAKADRAIADADQAQREREGLKDKLEGCFSWGGQVSNLMDQVKAKIHNPDSFEHVSTEIIEGEPLGDIKMTFRAENRFGGTRRYIAYGILKKDSDCKFILMGPSEDD